MGHNHQTRLQQIATRSVLSPPSSSAPTIDRFGSCSVYAHLIIAVVIVVVIVVRFHVDEYGKWGGQTLCFDGREDRPGLSQVLLGRTYLLL